MKYQKVSLSTYMLNVNMAIKLMANLPDFSGDGS